MTTEKKYLDYEDLKSAVPNVRYLFLEVAKISARTDDSGSP